MSARDRAEEALAKLHLSEAGMCVHFSYGQPVVHRSFQGQPEGDPLPDSTQHWEAAKARAAAQFEMVLRVVDWNRVVLEAVGAYLAMDEEHDVTMFGQDAGLSGRALKAALSVRDTMPDWWRMRRLERTDPEPIR